MELAGKGAVGGVDPTPLELTCFLQPGWAPRLRPAPATRPWMDATPGAFAYRCLPLDIANAHGWEVLSPCGFEALWSGGASVDAIDIRLVEGTEPSRAPVSLFGSGVLTFHVEGLFRTPPGWNLWVGGSPNRFKDGIAPLTAVVETDWSPFTFTMNWRFTRPAHTVTFDADEPIAFLFPVQRDALEHVRPRFAPIEQAPELGARFAAWSRARDAFHERLSREPPKTPAEAWQKHYYRGTDVEGRKLAPDHRTKLRLRAFDGGEAGEATAAPVARAALERDLFRPARGAAEPADSAEATLRRRERLMEATERQRSVSPATAGIARRTRLGREEFVERYYAPARPVILADAMTGWPALELWTHDYLALRIGPRVVAALRDRSTLATPGESGVHAGPLEVLVRDLGPLDVCLAPKPTRPDGALALGAAAAFVPLHNRPDNLLLCQITGRSRLRILPASESGRLYERPDGSSEVADFDDPSLDVARYGKLEGARCYEVHLAPGEALFLPLGWWRQVRALEASATLSFTDFAWPNAATHGSGC